MKKLFILFAFVLVTTLTFAQSRNSINTIALDTLDDAETVNIAVTELRSNYDVISITSVVTQLSGTAAGTLTLYGSFNNTDWVFINGVGAGIVTASPKASITGADLNQLTITNGLVANWVVTNNPYKHYRITAVGAGTQSTEISTSYKFQ